MNIRKHTSRLIAAFLIIATFLLIAGPFAVAARDWWIMETVYTIQDREPVEVAGPETRIFLPKMSAATVDGIDMDMTYEVKKDNEVFASGTYTEGVYVDLNGAGEYLFTIQGVDALNAYTFQIAASEENPSFIPSATLPLSVNQTDAFLAPEATIRYQDAEASAQIRLIMGSGAVYQSEGKSLPENGLMQVEYSAKIGEKTHIFTFDVDVIEGGFGFVDESGNLYPAGTKPYEDHDMAGAMLNSTANKIYTFNQILDLSKATKNDPLIVVNNGAVGDINVTPKVKIVDAHNPTNFIEIIGRISADNANMVYSVAATPGQTKIGHLGGVNYYNQTIFGTETTFPTSSKISKDAPATFYYDAAEKAVYANWYGAINLIADFDADYQMKPWAGFSTGEVYLVVERANENDFICVENVCGVSLAGSGSDTIAPSLTVNVDPENVPYAVVGKQYPVFQAEAVDMMDPAVVADIRVYRGSDAANGVELNVADGCFVPYAAGYYTIVYTAEDRFGNIAQQRINVQALSAENAPEMAAVIDTLPETAFVGEKIYLPEVQSVSGGSGDVNCSVRLAADDGTVTAISDEYIIIPSEGTNTIEYVLTDYIGTEKVISFAISCVKSDVPILYDLVMPQYLQSGTVWKLPTAEYAENPSAEITVTATLDGIPVAVENNTLTPVTDKSEAELIVTYCAQNNAGKTEKSYSIRILNGDVSDRTTFFRTETGNILLEQRDNSIYATTMESGSGVRFASALLAEKLNLVMAVDPEKNDSDRITITLTDVYDPSISVQLDIVKKPDGDDKSKSEFYINGVQVNDMVGNFYGGVASLTVTYKRSSNSFVDSEGNNLGKILTTQTGESFTGFPSNQVYMVISTGEVGSKGFGWNIMQINNQAFASDELFFDNYPELAVSGEVSLQCEIGGEIIAPAAYAVDVLSPNVDLTLTVRKGVNVITENQPIDQPYTVKFQEYGKYYIVYNYESGDVSRSVTYPVQIIERTVPQIEVPKIPEKASLNQTVKLESATVSDDYSVEVQTVIVVREPNCNMFNLEKETMSFVADQKGIYTVFYYVYDECFNYQVIEHTITVE